MGRYIFSLSGKSDLTLDMPSLTLPEELAEVREFLDIVLRNQGRAVAAAQRDLGGGSLPLPPLAAAEREAVALYLEKIGFPDLAFDVREGKHQTGAPGNSIDTLAARPRDEP